MKNLLTYFLQGLLYLVPLVVTIYVIAYVVRFADSIFAGVPVVSSIPGFGLIILLVLVVLVGYFGGRLVTPAFESWFNSAVARIPLVSLIYSSIRDLMKAFVGEKRKFDKPVLVRLDADGLNNRLGFITQDDLASIGLDGMVSVYSPYPYSIMGDLIIVKRSQVMPIDAAPAEVMKMIVSGGVSIPGSKPEEYDANEKK